VGGQKNFFCSLRSQNCPPHFQNRGAAPVSIDWLIESSETAECQRPSRVTCGQCSEAFTSPWLLLRHVHDAHALPVCPSDELVTLPALTTSTALHQASASADRVETADDAGTGTVPPLPPPRRRHTPTPTDVDVRSTSPRSDDLDWPGSRTSEQASPLHRAERSRTQSPAEPTRLPSQKLQRYLQADNLRLRTLWVTGNIRVCSHNVVQLASDHNQSASGNRILFKLLPIKNLSIWHRPKPPNVYYNNYINGL